MTNFWKRWSMEKTLCNSACKRTSEVYHLYRSFLVPFIFLYFTTIDIHICAVTQVIGLIRAYYQEAKWLRAQYILTFEEYIAKARITGVTQILATSSTMWMKEIMQVKPFEQIIQASKAIRACQVIGRLIYRVIQDIVNYEVFNSFPIPWKSC